MSEPRIAMVVSALAPERRALAERTSRELSLPIVSQGDVSPSSFDLVLIVGDDRVELGEASERGRVTITVDLLCLSIQSRVRRGRRDLLVRAVDPHGDRPRVVDTTAGLARDGFVLAAHGCEVIAVERSGVLGMMIVDAIERARRIGDRGTHAALDRLQPMVADAREVLRGLANEEAPDVVYLDPMYPQRRRHVAVKKELRICRVLVGEDDDAAGLLRVARQVAAKRVVVKRHRLSPPIDADMHRRYESKMVRFDVYLPKP